MAKETTTRPQDKTPNKTGSRPPRTPAAASRTAAGGAGSLSRGRSAPSILTFFQEARAELRKVTWPTRQETMNLTGAVIGMTVGIAAFLGIIDALLDQIIKPLIGAK